MGSATWALAGKDAGEVARAIAQNRHHVAVEGGEHHLAHLAVGHGLKGVGVNYFYDVVVFPEVHAVLILALEGHARTVHLGHTERVVGLDAQQTLDTAALLFGVRLGADEEGAQMGAAEVDAFLLEHLGQTDSV